MDDIMDYITIRIDEDFAYGVHRVLIIKKEGGKTYIAKPIEFIEHERGCLPQATLEVPLEHNFPKSVKAELAKLGLIDNADKATNDALKYHLEDMRSLVFKGKK